MSEETKVGVGVLWLNGVLTVEINGRQLHTNIHCISPEEGTYELKGFATHQLPIKTKSLQTALHAILVENPFIKAIVFERKTGNRNRRFRITLKSR